MYQFRTKDHPSANGRSPEPGDQGYRFFFPLEDGNVLVVLTGRKGFEALREIVTRCEEQARELPY